MLQCRYSPSFPNPSSRKDLLHSPRSRPSHQPWAPLSTSVILHFQLFLTIGFRLVSSQWNLILKNGISRVDLTQLTQSIDISVLARVTILFPKLRYLDGGHWYDPYNGVSKSVRPLPSHLPLFTSTRCTLPIRPKPVLLLILRCSKLQDFSEISQILEDFYILIVNRHLLVLDLKLQFYVQERNSYIH